MIVMSYVDANGRYITVKGKDMENFASEIDAAKNIIPDRILAIARNFNYKEQQKF